MKTAPAVLALWLCAAVVGESATFTVTTTNDAGAGSLRQAMLDANATAGADAIHFNIPGSGVQTIRPLSQLPTIEDPVVIDGYVQPGAAVNTLSNGNNAVLRVELSGVNLPAATYGLWIAATNCVVRGLVINRFTNDAVGILVEGFDGSVIEGNFIGTDATGTNALGNGTGILISDSTGHRIGGTAAASRNIIGGNQYGISFNVTTGNEVIGNYVGLGADGLATVSNLSGIFLHYSTGVQIGGSTPGARNVISGNGNGLTVNVGVSNLIQGNFVGTDASGTLSRGNAAGIGLNESSHNIIGGASAGDGNLLSGNLGSALMINGLDAKSNTVAGNLIGTDVTGKNALGNGDYGVFIGGASGNLVGGTDSGARNVISGNGRQGIAIFHYGGATGNVIQGNFIGTDLTGTNALGNELGGIWIAAPGNLLGGTNTGAGNVISGNPGYGVILVDVGSNNVVQGNIIGLDASGLRELGNSIGVSVQDATGNLIGGSTPGARNVISGNTNGAAYNVLISGPATDNRLEGNFIGPDVLGNGPIDNGYGIYIGEAHRNIVGGLAPGAGNRIAYNYAGVVLQLSGTTNNAILGNSIFANDLLGIDLGADGVTGNDGLDADAGPNQLQNFPVLTSATSAGGTSILGTLASAPHRSYRVEVFSTDGPLEQSGHGEGRTFIGSLNVPVGASGSNGFALYLPVPLEPGRFITATATDPDGNTSEFAAATAVSGLLNVEALSAWAGPIGSTLAIYGTNFSAVAPSNIVWFGGVRATVVSASATQLVVTVPVGAANAPVTVTTGGLTARSARAFAPTFDGVGGLETVSFAAPTEVGFATSLAAAAAADVDGDGRIDLIVANQGSGVIRVFRNQGVAGVLSSNSFAVPLSFSVGALPNSIALEDMDGDGRLDVVTATSSAPLLSILRNTSAPGAISFQAAATFPISGTSHAGLAVADFDGDGRLDVATANGGTNSVSVLQNLGTPGAISMASPLDLPVGVVPIRLAAADLDGDGHPDIVTASAAGSRVTVLRNLGGGGLLVTNSFAAKFDLPSLSAPYDVAVGDLDGDGRPDLASAISQNLVSVWRNGSTPGILGPGSFSARVDFPIAASSSAAGFPWTIGIADLNGDAKPELFTANYKTNFVSVLRNTSAVGSLNTNSFASWVGFATGFGPFHVVSGDLDGDGRPDLVSANTPGNTVSLLRNSLGPVCVPPTESLVAWWRGEGNGLDAAGVHHATLSGSSMFAAGLAGQAFQFNGTPTHQPWAFRVEVPAHPALSPHANDTGETGLAPDPRAIGEMSVQAWIRIPALPVGQSNENDPIRYAVRKLGSAGNEYGLFIATNGQAGFVVLRYGGQAFETRGGTVTPNQWHHLVGTYKQNTHVRLYLDGVQVAELPFPMFLGSVTTSDFVIGHGGLFEGLIDEVGLFRRALSTTEIQALYRAGTAGMCSLVQFDVGVLGGGGVSRSPDKRFFFDGETVELTATSRPYYTFLRWSDGVTSASRVIEAGTVEALVAIFTNAVPLETLAFPQWDRSFGGIEFDSYPTIRYTADGGYVLAGSTTSGAGGNKTTPLCGTTAAWIVKLDADGNRQWEQTVGAPGDSLFVVTIETTPDGGYVLGASSAVAAGAVTGNCGKSSANFGLADFWLVRLNAAGERVWDTTYGGDGVDGLSAIAVLEEGGFVLAGTSSSGPTGNKSSPHRGSKDCWVVRVDANGNRLWDRSFGGAGNENALAVTLLSDGGFLLAGNSSSGIEGNKTAPNHGGLDYWVVRLDAQGNKLWDRSYGGDSDDIGGWMTPMPGGGALLVGYSDSSISGTKSAPDRGGADYWVVRIDAGGNQLWDRSLGGLGEYDWAYNVKAAADGGVLVVGESDTDISGNKTTSQIGNSDGWLVRLDPYGEKSSEVSLGGIEYDYLWSVDEAGPAAFILAGGSSSDVGGNKSAPLWGNEDFWVIKMVERTAPVGTPVILVNGQFSPTNHFVGTNSAVVSIETTLANGHIFYTLDGAAPGTGSTYSGPFAVSQTLVVRALAYNEDYSLSVEADPVTITLVTSPVITLQPDSAVVRSGTDVILLVDAAGATPLAYQWMFNGELISGATNSFLIRNNVQSASAGSYRAIVSNSYGSTTSAVAELTVLVPPAILAQPSTTNVNIGEAVTHCVSVIGSGPLAFQWRKNGVNLVGQTNSCLVINPVVVASGGSYTVVIQNDIDAITSEPARLLLNVNAPPTADDFANATVLSSDIQGSVRGTNRLATRESGEPPHGAGGGGRTVWYKFNGVPSGGFTFDTVGSTFDTLLAIYTGTNVSSLTLVAKDDDSGGFHTSKAGFTQTQPPYYIAIDGFAGESGEFILNWSADLSLPVVVTQPASQSVTNGGTAVFGVTAVGTPSVLYQWKFNGVDLAGQTNSLLVISNVLPINVGLYTVNVRNSDFPGSVLSVPAVLEIGPLATLYSVDRVEEILNSFGGLGPFELAAAGSSVSIGSLGTQILNTTNSTTSFRETNHCGVIGGASRWFKLIPATNATFVMDTEGSAFNTVLAIYIGDPGLGGYPTKLVGCNDNAEMGVSWSRVAFAATNGVEYLIAVDGVGGASGAVTLNWWLGNPPVIGAVPPVLQTPIAREGTNLTLVTSLTNGIPPPRVQWYRNQTLLANATNASLALNNVQLGHAGTYSVVVRNPIGMLTSIVARVTVDVPLNLGVITVTQDGRTHVRVSGTASQNFVIQGTTNFANWIPLYTNPAAQQVDFEDRSATNRPRRFYRAVPWP